MGDAINENSANAERSNELDANYMRKSDIDAINAEVRAMAVEAARKLEQTRYGVQYNDSMDAVSRWLESVDIILRNFMRRNKWMSKGQRREEYLCSETEDLTAEDREIVVELYDNASHLLKVTAAFTEFTNEAFNSTFYCAYCIIRFFKKLQETYKTEEIDRIVAAFAEFSKIYRRYSRDSIYQELPVSKSKNTFEEIYELTLDYMDEDLMHTLYLRDFLLNTKQTGAYEINRLHFLDRDTRIFAGYITDEWDRIKRSYDKLREISKNHMAAYLKKELLCMEGFYDGFVMIHTRMLDLYGDVNMLIEEFKKNDQVAPYSIMHYDSIIKNVASNELFYSLKDPLTNGTAYEALANAMLKRCRELAKAVAKSAP